MPHSRGRPRLERARERSRYSCCAFGEQGGKIDGKQPPLSAEEEEAEAAARKEPVGHAVHMLLASRPATFWFSALLKTNLNHPEPALVFHPPGNQLE